jgi:hypothetical protein
MNALHESISDALLSGRQRGRCSMMPWPRRDIEREMARRLVSRIGIARVAVRDVHDVGRSERRRG